MSLNRATSRRRTTSRRTTSRRTTSRRRTPFSWTTGTNCGYEPRIPSSSSRGEVLARAPSASQKGFSTQKCRERVLLRVIEILRLSDLIYFKGKLSQRCRCTQLTLHSPLTHTTRTYHLNFEHAQSPKDSRQQFT